MKIKLRARVKALNVTDTGLILKLDPTERYESDGKTVFAVTRLDENSGTESNDGIDKDGFGEALREVTYYEYGEVSESGVECTVSGDAFKNVIPSLASREATFALEWEAKSKSWIVKEIEFHF